MIQEPLPFDSTPNWTKARFDGATYDHARDQVRLSGQIALVFELMKDGEWRSLRTIAEITEQPEASISTRLRDFRKVRFGGHTVNRKYIGDGLYLYQLILAQ